MPLQVTFHVALQDYTHPSRGRLRVLVRAGCTVTSQIPGTDRAHTSSTILVVLPFRVVVSIELKSWHKSIPAGAARALAQAVVYDNVLRFTTAALHAPTRACGSPESPGRSHLVPPSTVICKCGALARVPFVLDGR